MIVELRGLLDVLGTDVIEVWYYDELIYEGPIDENVWDDLKEYLGYQVDSVATVGGDYVEITIV